MDFKLTINYINTLLYKGNVVHIWTFENNQIGCKVETLARSTIVPKKEFTDGLLIDMIENGVIKDKYGYVNFLIYVHRDGKYGILDNNKKI